MKTDIKPLIVVAVIGLAVWLWSKSKPAEAAPEHGLVGDLNNDGIVDQDDQLLLMNYILSEGTPDADVLIAQSGLTKEEFLRRADVNGDGVINVLDITAMIKLVVSHEEAHRAVEPVIAQGVGALFEAIASGVPLEALPPYPTPEEQRQAYLAVSITQAQLPDDIDERTKTIVIIGDALKRQEAERLVVSEAPKHANWWIATEAWSKAQGISIEEAYERKTGEKMPFTDPLK